MKLFFIYFLLSSSLYAKTDSSGYVLKYFGQRSNANLEIENPTTPKILKYEGNTGTSSNIMIAKNGLAISFPINIAKTSDAEAFTKGKSKSSDFQFTYVKDWFGIDIIYQDYDGFFLNDSEFKTTQTNSAGIPVSVFQQYSSMHLKRQSVNLYYLSNPKGFSYNAAFSQSERQTSSGGSWISMITVANFLVENSTTFIPTTYQGNFGTLKKGKALGFSYMFGGAYTFSFGSPYLTLMLVVGPTRYTSHFEYNNTSESKTRENARSLTRLAIGYNGESFIVSSTFTYDQLSFKARDTKIKPGAAVVQFSLGYRF